MDKTKKGKIEDKHIGEFAGAFGVVERKITLPGQGQKLIRYADRIPASVIVPILDKRILLLRQFRGAVNKEIYELPAGKIDPGEVPMEAAIRELEEETGYKAKKVVQLFRSLPSPGYTNEFHHFFAIECGKNVGQRLEDDERGLRVLSVSVSEALRMIRRNQIEDGKTIQGILYYNLLRT